MDGRPVGHNASFTVFRFVDTYYSTIWNGYRFLDLRGSVKLVVYMYLVLNGGRFSDRGQTETRQTKAALTEYERRLKEEGADEG